MLRSKQKIVGKLIFIGILFVTTSFDGRPPGKNLLGIWETDDKELRIQMFQEGNHFAGKIVWFYCPPGTPPMKFHLDSQNADPNLRRFPWLGLKVGDKFRYQGNNQWGGGTLYDPNTGYTMDGILTMPDKNRLIARGYWKFSVIGKSLTFHRVK